MKNKLPDNCLIKFDTTRRRLSRRRPLVYQLECSSPLRSVEEITGTMIIQIARIHQSLTLSKESQLVNDLIADTNVQQNLTESYTSNSDGQEGQNYWHIFMRRHGDKIRSKRGHKYYLGRSKWFT